MNVTDNITWYQVENNQFYSNIQNIDSAIETQNPLLLKIFFYNDELQRLLDNILDRLLLHLDIIWLKDSISFILRELVINGVKANAKRIFLEQVESDIDDPLKYFQVISGFKQTIIKEKAKYDQLLVEKDCHVIIILNYDSQELYLKVINKSPISKIELERINKRIDKAKEYDDLIEAYADVSDDSEGAGLGIVTSIMMLRNDGINPDSFNISKVNNSTKADLQLPLAIETKNPFYQKAQSIIDDLLVLPTFSATIEQIQKLIRNPESTIEQISTLVNTDVALTANLLKLANTAAFIQQTRVDSVEKAVKLIGLKELNNLLYSIGTKRIMEGKYKDFESVWDRSNEVAYFCRLLAERRGWKKNFITNLVSAALLHDIGQVVILSLEPEKIETISKIAEDRKMHTTLILEELSLGISHATVGGLLAERWNFPSEYKEVIKYHHKPLMAADEYKDFVYPVYMADMLTKINDGKAKYAQLNQEILQYFNFKNEEELDRFLKKAIENKSTDMNR